MVLYETSHSLTTYNPWGIMQIPTAFTAWLPLICYQLTCTCGGRRHVHNLTATSNYLTRSTTHSAADDLLHNRSYLTYILQYHGDLSISPIVYT